MQKYFLKFWKHCVIMLMFSLSSWIRYESDVRMNNGETVSYIIHMSQNGNVRNSGYA